MEYILEVVAWMLIASVKFLFTPSFMIGAGDYELLETILITQAGAMLGICVFYFAGGAIFMKLDSLRRKKHKKIFSKKNRTIVRVKNKFGVVGLVATIGLISVPLCSLLAARYFRHSRATIWLLMGSAAVWTVLLSVGSFYIKPLFL